MEAPVGIFDNMGKPISYETKAVALKHCEAMGLETTRAVECIDKMAAQLERNRPYEAQQIGREYLDLTGMYRLLASLLSGSIQTKRASK
jgi:hypothetical protein